MNCGQTLGGRENWRPCRTSRQTAFCRACPAPRGSDGNAPCSPLPPGAPPTFVNSVV